MRWKSTETLRQSIGSVTANVNNLLWVLMLGPILQCYDFKQAVYSTTLKSPLARLLDNLTERGVFLVVRLLPAALLSQSERSTALCHAALPYSRPPGLVCNGAGQPPKGHFAATGEKQDLCSPRVLGQLVTAEAQKKTGCIAPQIYLTVLQWFMCPFFF